LISISLVTSELPLLLTRSPFSPSELYKIFYFGCRENYTGEIPAPLELDNNKVDIPTVIVPFWTLTHIKLLGFLEP
jgi:hypothetical protein